MDYLKSRLGSVPAHAFLFLAAINFFASCSTIIHEGAPDLTHATIQIDNILSLVNKQQYEKANIEIEIFLKNDRNSRSELANKLNDYAISIVPRNPKEALWISNKVIEFSNDIPDKKIKAISLGTTGEAYRLLNLYDKAKESFISGRSIARKIDDRYLIGIYSARIVDCMDRTGDPVGAIKEGEAILAEWGNESGALGAKAELLGLLSIVYGKQNPKKGLESAIAAKNIFVALHDEESIRGINVNISRWLAELSEFQKALELINGTIDYYESSDKLDKAAVAYILKGDILFKEGEYTKAHQAFKEAINRLKKTKHGAGLVLAEYQYAAELFELAEYDVGYEHLLTSLRIAKEIDDRRMIAHIYTYMIQFNLKIGDFPSAELCFDEAMKAVGEFEGKNECLRTIGLAVYQGSDYFLGKKDYSMAHKLLYYSKDIFTQIKDKETLCGIYLSYADLFNQLGDREQAKSYLNIVEGFGQQTLDTIYDYEMSAKLGRLYTSLGENLSAAKNIDKSYRLAIALKDANKEADALRAFGNFQFGLENYGLAENYYKKAAAIQGKEDDNLIMPITILKETKNRNYAKAYEIMTNYSYSKNDLEDRATMRGMLGFILALQGKYQEAIPILIEANSANEKLGENIKERYVLSNFLETKNAIIDTLIASLYALNSEDPKNAVEALNASESARARAFKKEYRKPQKQTLDTVASALQVRRNRLYAEIESYIALLRNTKNDSEISRIKRLIVDKEEELSNTESSIENPNRSLKASFKMAPITLSEIDKGMVRDKETAILEYYLSSSISVVFIIKDNSINMVALNESEQKITEDVLKIRGTYERIRKGAFILSELSNYDYIATINLYKALIEPASKYLGGVKKLLIIPHKALCYLPFECLISSQDQVGKDSSKMFSKYAEFKYLIDDYEISYLPTAHYREIIGKNGDKKLESINLLVVGNPDYGADEEEGKNSALMELPNAGFEVAAIAKKFKNPKILVNKDASKEAVIREIGNYNLIHIATHGILDDNEPAFSSLALSFNREEREIDYLNVYDIGNLKLDCDLVVLSACETGVGQKIEEISGEGVLGMPRAFLEAGAKSVIVSLWQVSDESTKVFMEFFYDHLLLEKGESGQALRLAKLNIKDSEGKFGNKTISYSHPFFWAPFVLMGGIN